MLSCHVPSPEGDVSGVGRRKPVGWLFPHRNAHAPSGLLGLSPFEAHDQYPKSQNSVKFLNSLRITNSSAKSGAQ